MINDFNYDFEEILGSKASSKLLIKEHLFLVTL